MHGYTSDFKQEEVQNFEPKQKSLRKEIFVAMSFAEEYDKIYKKLIKPAVEKSNEKLKYSGDEELKPYRTKDDPRTVSGWINILEHLFTAQIVQYCPELR